MTTSNRVIFVCGENSNRSQRDKAVAPLFSSNLPSSLFGETLIFVKKP